MFECRDGRWLAVAVQSDDEWQRLLDALGRPAALARPEWVAEAARWRDRAEVESILAEYLVAGDVVALDDLLAVSGVPAAVVNRALELLDDEHLHARDFFPRVDHADPNIEDARIVGMPWRIVGEGPLLQTPPPRLGDANADLIPEGTRS